MGASYSVTTKSINNVDLNKLKEIHQGVDKIIAETNAERAAAEQAAAEAGNVGTHGNPIDNAQSDIEEVTKPLNEAVTLWDRMRQRQEEEYKREKDRETARLALERTGRDFAGLAAVIGDTIRAHEGAPVNPRDWQQIYDNLTAQERANVNNYQVRMQKLREDARADRMAQAQAAAKAASDSQKRQYEWLLAYIERNWKGNQNDKKNLIELIKAQMTANARIEASRHGSGSSAKPVRFTAFGKSYDVIGDERSFTSMMNDILRVINDRSNTADGKAYKAVSYIPEEVGKDPQGFYNRRVKELIGPESIGQYKQSAIKEIEDIINAYQFGSEPGVKFGDYGKPVRQ